MPKILVVDDDEGIRMSVTCILERRGYEVLQAEDGNKGFDLALQHLPDLIISDVNMENTDGYGLLASLRQTHETVDIPMILMTGFSSPDGMRQGMELGADDYIPKPFTAQSLTAAVETRLKKHQAIKQKAEKTLSDLRANLCLSLPHELNTPLTGIIGLSELILEDAAELPPHIVDLVQSIGKSSDRLRRLIENFLLYAQIELLSSNQSEVAAMRSRVSQPARDLLTPPLQQWAKAAGRANDLTVEMDVSSAAMSSDLLLRIARELADNAFKYSKPGTPVHVTFWSEESHVILRVEDQGRGMKPEEIQAVGAFMQFQRRVYEQQGSGLGLIITRRLTDLHQGTLIIESAPDKGTTVMLKLPLGQPEAVS